MGVLLQEGEDGGSKQESSPEVKSTRNGKDTANTSDFSSEDGPLFQQKQQQPSP